MNWPAIAGHLGITAAACAVGALLHVDLGLAVGGAYFAREAAQWIENDHWGWGTALGVVWRGGWDTRAQGLGPLALGLAAAAGRVIWEMT
jgi:hypothetical protein